MKMKTAFSYIQNVRLLVAILASGGIISAAWSEHHLQQKKASKACKVKWELKPDGRIYETLYTEASEADFTSKLTFALN